MKEGEKLEKWERTKFSHALCLLLMLCSVWVEQRLTWLWATLVQRSTTSHISPLCPVVYTALSQHTLTWNRYENVAFRFHLSYMNWLTYPQVSNLSYLRAQNITSSHLVHIFDFHESELNYFPRHFSPECKNKIDVFHGFEVIASTICTCSFDQLCQRNCFKCQVHQLKEGNNSNQVLSLFHPMSHDIADC